MQVCRIKYQQKSCPSSLANAIWRNYRKCASLKPIPMGTLEFSFYCCSRQMEEVAKKLEKKHRDINELFERNFYFYQSQTFNSVLFAKSVQNFDDIRLSIQIIYFLRLKLIFQTCGKFYQENFKDTAQSSQIRHGAISRERKKIS